MMMKRIITLLSFLFISINSFAQSGYILPWQCGNTYTCTQGNNGTTSHTGTEAYAFDFNLPLNTPVIAMRAGVITHVTESFANNNCPYPNCSSCINDVNRIVVDHGNGTYGLYLHLSQNGSIYNVGDAVSQGQVIGYSGNSGCTTGAHLHVMLMNSNNCGNSWWCQSIPLSFDNVYTNGGVPTSGNSYSSGPSNDLCGGAITLTVGSSCNYISGTTCGANPISPSTGMTTCSSVSNTTAKDVWYKFTATQTGNMTIGVQSGSNFDAVFQVFSSVTCGSSYTQLACIDATGVGALESSTLSVTSGVQYWVRVYNYSTSNIGTDFQICVYNTTQNQPDLTITNGTQNVSSSTVCAGANITASCSQDNSGNGTAASGTAVSLWLGSNPLNTNTAVYVGSITGYTTMLGGSNSPILNTSVTIPANTPSGNYYLWFWADGGTCTTSGVTCSTCSGIATESNECNNLASVQITVNGLPTNVTVSGGGASCNSTTLNASGGVGGTIYWQGTTPSGTSTATPSSSQTITTSGTYYFRSHNSCGWGTEGSANVTISSMPGSVSVTGGGTFCNSATLNASGGSGGTIYWQGTNSNGTSTATPSSSQTVTSSGTYYFRAYSSCGWGTQGSATVTINNTPSQPTSISGSTTPCQGTSQTYSINAVSGATSYTWTNPWGWSTIGATTSINGTMSTASGNVTVTANNSCGSSTAQSLAITPATTPQLTTISGINPVCINSSQTYSVNNISGATYTWSTPWGWSTGSTNSITGIVSSSGTISVHAANNCGTGNTQTLNVTITTGITPTCSIEVTPDDTVCGNPFVPITFTCTTNVNNASYQWYKGGNAQSGATDSTYSPSAYNNLSQFYCIVTAGSGSCYAPSTATSNTMTIHTVQVPNTPQTATINLASVCMGDSILLTATCINLGNATLVWYEGSCGNGNPVAYSNTSGASVVIYPTTSAKYYVRTEIASCINPNCKSDSITVNQPPTANAGNDVTYSGTPVAIGGNPSGQGGTAPLSYSWWPTGNLSSSTATNPTASPTITTNYELTVTDNVGCKDKDTVLVTSNLVNCTYTLSDTIYSSPCSGGNHVVTVFPSDTSCTWQVSGTILSWLHVYKSMNDVGIIVDPTSNGNLRFCNFFIAGIPFLVVQCATGIGNHESVENSITILPNPTNDQITIKAIGLSNGNYTLELHNLLGQIILKETIEITNHSLLKQLSLAPFADCVYMLNIKGNDVNVTKKVQKIN